MLHSMSLACRVARSVWCVMTNMFCPRLFCLSSHRVTPPPLHASVAIHLLCDRCKVSCRRGSPRRARSSGEDERDACSLGGAGICTRGASSRRWTSTSCRKLCAPALRACAFRCASDCFCFAALAVCALQVRDCLTLLRLLLAACC